MKQIRTFFITIFSLLLSHGYSQTLPANSEAGFPLIQNFGPREYDAGGTNWCIAQDQRGIMYFANDEGVLEYDGVRWRLITLPKYRAVRSVSIDLNNRVWIGGEKELGYLAPDQAGQLEYVSIRDQVPVEYRGFSSVWQVLANQDGVYFKTPNTLIRLKDDRFKIWRADATFRIYQVRDSLYVRYNGRGLMKVEITETPETDSLKMMPGGEAFADTGVWLLYPFSSEKVAGDPDRQMLLATHDEGLFAYDGNSFQPFPTEADSFLINNQLYDGDMLPDGKFAFGTERAGLAIVDSDGRFLNKIDKTSGLNSEIIRYVFTDRQHQIWLGLDDGTAVLNPESPFSLFNENNGLSSAVHQIKRFDDHIFAITPLGVYKMEPPQESWRLPVFYPVPELDGYGRDMLPMENEMLISFSHSLYRLQENATRGELIDYLSTVELFRMAEQPQRVFVGDWDSLGVVEKVNGKWQPYQRLSELNGEITGMAADENSNLWAVTSEHGVFRFDFKNAGFPLTDISQIKAENYDRKNGLPESDFSIYSANGRVYFSSGYGLRRFDPESKTFPLDASLGDIFADSTLWIDFMEEDRRGRIWIKWEKNGQSRINILTLTEDSVTAVNEFPLELLAELGTVSPPYFDDANHDIIWFYGQKGILRFDEARQAATVPQFQAAIRKVSVAEDSLIFGGGHIDSSAANPVKIAYAVSELLRFDFTALPLGIASTRYRYKLEGYDRDWSEWGETAHKEYTRIPEGKYLFKVQAKREFGNAGAEAAYAFSVLPPWYRTGFAYFGYFLVFIGAVWGLMYYYNRWNTRKLQERTDQLEEIVEERTREIRQQAEELSTLDGIVLIINQETILEKVLHVLLEQGVRLFPQAEKASFLLRNPQKNQFQFVAAIGYDDVQLKQIALTEKEVLSRYTENSQQIDKQAFIVNQFQNISGQQKLDFLIMPKSILAMAVVLQDQLEGFFVLDNFQDGNAFNNSDVERMSRFRHHAVTAIAKAKILQALKDQNEKLIQTQQKLITQEKLASLGQLTAGIAHEIKNPLNFVKNFAELTEDFVTELKEGVESEKANISAENYEEIDYLLEQIGENVQTIKNHGQRANSIIQSMLQHSRGKAGEVQETDINWTLRENLNLAFHGMRARDSSFSADFDAKYDDTIGNIKVVPQDISRVFLNIMTNGFYAANKKQINTGKEFSARLSVESRNLEDQVEIRIRDNGDGIPQDVREKIFNPFFTTKPAGEGTGLGLSISYDIVVKLHGGEILVESEPGEFTEFIIRLPKS